MPGRLIECGTAPLCCSSCVPFAHKLCSPNTALVDFSRKDNVTCPDLHYTVYTQKLRDHKKCTQCTHRSYVATRNVHRKHGLSQQKILCCVLVKWPLYEQLKQYTEMSMFVLKPAHRVAVDLSIHKSVIRCFRVQWHESTQSLKPYPCLESLKPY